MPGYEHRDPDAELVRAFMEGRDPDRSQFKELLRRVKGCICHKEPTLFGDAEELTQQTIVRAYEHIDEFRWDSLFFTWITGIAINIIREHCRKPDNQTAGGVEEMLAEIAGTDDPERQALQQLAHQDALNLLDVLEQRVVQMSLNERMTFREIAAKCGLKDTAEAQRVMYRALRKIKRHWTDSGWDGS